MFGMEILEVAIGLTFTFFILSQICSGVFELISRISNKRARHLEDAIRRMLNDDGSDGRNSGLSKVFYSHPYIKSLWRKKIGKPTWIPNKKFAATLMDILAPEDPEAGSEWVNELKSDLSAILDDPRVEESFTLIKGVVEEGAKVSEWKAAINRHIKDEKLRDQMLKVVDDLNARDRITKFRDKVSDLMTDENLKDQLLKVIETGELKIEALRERVEGWFDSTMTDVSKFFRNQVKNVILVTSIVLVGLLNADAIQLAKTFWNDDAIRESVVAMAADKVTEYEEKINADPKNSESVKEAVKDLNQLVDDMKPLPVGWGLERWPAPKVAFNWLWTKWLLLKLLGLSLTVGAVSLGSPFWYDVLTRLLRIGGKDKSD